MNTLEEARLKAMRVGINGVSIGNLVDHPAGSTYPPMREKVG
jgi:hypothetical protein